jgi:hypothetical protein
MQMRVDGNPPGGLYGRVQAEQSASEAKAPTTTPPGMLTGATQTTPTSESDGTNFEGSSTPQLLEASGEQSDLGEVTAKMFGTQAGTFNMQQLFVELLDVGKTLKTVTRLDREAHLNKVEAEAKAAADDMRASAWLSLAATVVTSTLQIAGSAVSLKGAAASQKAFTDAMGKAPTPDPTPNVTLNQATQQQQLVMAQFQARSTFVTEGGKLVASVPQLIAQHFEASKSDHQAKSAREQATADNEGDYKQAAEKLIASVLDKMSEMQRAQAQAMSSIARMG